MATGVEGVLREGDLWESDLLNGDLLKGNLQATMAKSIGNHGQVRRQGKAAGKEETRERRRRPSTRMACLRGGQGRTRRNGAKREKREKIRKGGIL